MINVMNEYSSFSRKCITNYMKMIFGSKYDKKINDAFLDSYILVRYSNYLDEESVKLSLQKKISKAFDNVQLSLKQEEFDSGLVDKFRHFYSYVYGLDQLYLLETQKKAINDINDDRVRLLKVEEDNFITELNNLLRDDVKKRKIFLDSFDSDTFVVKYNNLTKVDIGVSVENNIKFPELYSEVSIKKVGEKDVVSEDIAIINYLQTSVRIINDIIECDFEKLYYVHLPSSFFDKKTKLSRVTSIIDDEFIQDRLRLVVTYSCFVRYKTYVMELMRQGFIFAIYLDKGFDYCSDNIEYLEAFDKILMEKGKYYYKDMINNGKIGNRIISIEEVK